jgi:hypothetical protein
MDAPGPVPPSNKSALVQLIGVLVAFGVTVAALTIPDVALAAFVGLGLCGAGLAAAAVLDGVRGVTNEEV